MIRPIVSFLARFDFQERADWLSPRRLAAWLASVDYSGSAAAELVGTGDDDGQAGLEEGVHDRAVAVALGAVDAVLATLSMRTRPVRCLALCGMAGVVAAGFVLLPTPVRVGRLVVAAVWPVFMFLVSLRLRDILGQDESAIAAELKRRQEAAVGAAYRRGQQLVIDLVEAAADDA